MQTNKFKEQHQDLLQVVGEIAAHIQANTVADNAPAIASNLAKLSGKIGIHLAMEDKSLYPKMIDSGNPTAAQKAQQFQGEMGGLAEAFTTYKTKWMSPSKIAEDAATFAKETQDIVKALGDRIKREESELYPLAETV